MATAARFAIFRGADGALARPTGAQRGRRERPVMDGFESLVAIPAREDLNRAYTRQFRSKVLGESVE